MIGKFFELSLTAGKMADIFNQYRNRSVCIGNELDMIFVVVFLHWDIDFNSGISS